MATAAHGPYLTEAEVRERIGSYDDPRTTGYLHEFGQMLLKDANEQMGRLDTKALSVAGYSGALLALLLSSSAAWSKLTTGWLLLAPTLAMAALLAASVLAILSTTLKKMDWFSADEWFSADAIEDTERLRAYYLLVTWNVIQGMQTRCERKARSLKRAYYSIVFAWGFLALALAGIAWNLCAR